MTQSLLSGLMLGFGLVLAPSAQALTAERIGSGFTEPVFLGAPIGDSRLFIVEKAGVIKVQQGGSVSTFLDIRSRVNSDGERGLLGLAFDPAFASNGRFYVNYIDATTKNTVVASFTAPSPGSGAADAASRKTIMVIDQPANLSNHKAGWIGFRPGEAGNLYIATGDGGSGNDPFNNAQNTNSTLGKMLRITPLAGGGYTSPGSNPFAGATPGRDEIWDYGLRNPFRNSFDRSTGDLWIGDVGQDTREEINFEARGFAGGANYGWRAREGSVDNPGVPDPAPPGATDPFFDYAHGTLGASVIGGYVYRGGADAALEGQYVFGDFVSGKLFTLNQAGGGASFADRTAEWGTPFGGFTLSSFGEDGFGGLYATGLNGDIYRLAAAVPEPGTGLLLGAGGLVLAALYRRRAINAGCRPSTGT